MLLKHNYDLVIVLLCVLENVNTDDVYSQAIWQQEHTVVTAGKRQVCEFRRDEKETIASCVSTSPKSNISPIHDNLTSTLAGTIQFVSFVLSSWYTVVAHRDFLDKVMCSIGS